MAQKMTMPGDEGSKKLLHCMCVTRNCRRKRLCRHLF